MSKRAVILAGGMGTRLRPYTVVLPKPLMPIGEFPILEVIVRQLARRGFSHITLAVNHLAEIIQAFFGKGEKWNVRIDYSLEDRPLGTMGPLRLIPDLPENFLVMNGDVLTDLDFSAFLDYHIERKSVFTIASHVREHRVDYGVLDTERGRLTGFREKPAMNYEVSMGIYGVSAGALRWIPAGRPYGFDDLMKDLLRQSIGVETRRHEGLWLDIGRPEDYSTALEEFQQRRAQLLEG